MLLPSTFHPSRLSDREKYLDYYEYLLDSIARYGSVRSNFLEVYGTPGIGKTSLLSMLTDVSSRKKVPWMLVNFNQTFAKQIEYLHDPTTLIEEMIIGLKPWLNLGSPEFERQLSTYRNVLLPEGGVVPVYAGMDQESRLYRRPPWLDGLRNVIVEFIRLIQSVPGFGEEVCPVVFFFDETEYADVELLDWIEEWILNPILQIDHCVVVWTGRRPWRWKRPEVRRRLTGKSLDVFEPEIVKEQIRNGSVQPDLITDLYQNIQLLTGGHPFANSIVINELDLLTRQGQAITPGTFPEFGSRLITEVFQKFIHEYAFRDLSSVELKTACKFIALVRLFDTKMLREILQACAADLFGSWEDEKFRDLLSQLKKTPLLVWEKGYALDPGLRHIIENYFIVAEPDLFVKAHQAALHAYADWLDHPVENRGLLIVEELYQHASLVRVGLQVDSIELLRKRLMQYPHWIKDENALESALERLEGEIANDQELAQYMQLQGGLLKQIQQFRETRRSKKSSEDEPRHRGSTRRK
jgi:hypothetical protein